MLFWLLLRPHGSMMVSGLRLAILRCANKGRDMLDIISGLGSCLVFILSDRTNAMAARMPYRLFPAASRICSVLSLERQAILTHAL